MRAFFPPTLALVLVCLPSCTSVPAPEEEDKSASDDDSAPSGSDPSPGEQSDGLITETCESLEEKGSPMWAELCDKDGDGNDDGNDPIVIVEPGDPDDPTDDTPIISINPPGSGGNPIEILIDKARDLLPPNPGCSIVNLIDGVFGLPPAPPGHECGALSIFDPDSDMSQWPSCRRCLAEGTAALASGRGTIGECPLAEAIARSAANRFAQAEQEPNGIQKAFLKGLNFMSSIGLGGFDVACPPDLEGLVLGEAQPEWDDLLYEVGGHCGSLCEVDEPLSCHSNPASCTGMYYVASPGSTSPTQFTLREGVPSNPLAGDPPISIPVACTPTLLDGSSGAGALLNLCCPATDIGGVACSRLYSLAAD